MVEYLVAGGRPLSGTLQVQGAKNSVLPILAAALLVPGECVIRNCPDLSDVNASVRILEHLGCQVRQEEGQVTVNAGRLSCSDVPEELMREMRSSVIFLGAILARVGEGTISYPGGCELGPRPIDLHLKALRQLGVEVEERFGTLCCSAPRMKGSEISLSIPSVGATENAILAACGAEGVTVITNAAREPEIVDLQNFLLAMGARIRGAGSSTIMVEGKTALRGGSYSIMGDRIAAATYLSAAAAAGGEVELAGVDYRHLSTVTAALSEAGCRISSGPEYILLRRTGRLNGIRPIRTAPYPGFPTDAQAILMAALCTASGATVFVENIFESRYRHVDELARMGADIRVEGRVAVVYGVDRLHGARLRCTDLRGGAAMVVAALSAEGESVITGLEHIDRGYDHMERQLAALGAEVRRINT